MRQIELNPKVNELPEMTRLYGLFDLDVNSGRPTEHWERRTMQRMRLPFPLQCQHFPEFWIRRVLVNRRAASALAGALGQLAAEYTVEAMAAKGLDRFVRCYAFGHGEPSLFWYGAAWELSPEVTGEDLSDSIKIFARHGWQYAGFNDKKRLRIFEFW